MRVGGGLLDYLLTVFCNWFWYAGPERAVRVVNTDRKMRKWGGGCVGQGMRECGGWGVACWLFRFMCVKRMKIVGENWRICGGMGVSGGGVLAYENCRK